MKSLRFLLSLGLLSFPAFSGATATYYPAANIIEPVMDLSSSPRAMAMGGAGTALDGDIYSIYGNPAGLAQMTQDLEVSYLDSSINPVLGLSQQEMLIGTNTRVGAIAFGFNYVNLGSFNTYDASGDFAGAVAGLDIGLNLGGAKNFFDGQLSVGALLDTTFQEIAGNWILSPNGGLGTIWHVSSNFNLAASLSPFWFYTSPSLSLSPRAAGSLGSSLSFLDGKILLLADVLIPDDDASALRGGFEWQPLSYFAFRGGWRQTLSDDQAELQTGPTVGFSVAVKKARLDYTFMSYEGTPRQLVAITIDFPSSWVKVQPEIVVEAVGGTTAAKSSYDLGKQLLKNGQNVDALVAFKQCLQFEAGYTDAQAEIDSIVAQLNSSGPNSAKNREVEAMISRFLDAGNKMFQAGKYKKAIDNWEIALEVDKQNAEILNHIKQAREQLDTATAALMEKAAQCLENHDLEGAVKNLYDVLALDPDDKDAQARFVTLKPRILAEAKRLHRQGIDFYVNDQVDQAIDCWRRALALDHSDAENVKRDLDKALKLKELRGN